MQTVTDNQEQTVLAARQTVENYLESQEKLPIHIKIHGSHFLIWIVSRVSVNVAEMLEKATNSSERNINH